MLLNEQENLPVWLRASINKHFSDVLGGELFLQAEGAPLEIQGKTEYVELFVSGPRPFNSTQISTTVSTTAGDETVMISSGTVYLEIGAVISCEKSNNIYRLDELVGKIQKCMTDIIIKNYKTASAGEETFVGCLILRSDINSPIDVIPYGETKPGLLQRSVEGYYKMDF